MIPQQLRVELGIHAGDEVEMWREGDHVGLRVVPAPRPLLGRLAGEDLLGDLAEERAAERVRDARR